MGSKYYSPRWLHKEFILQAGAGDQMLPGSTFANDEIYDWELQWLSIVGTVALGGQGGDPFTAAFGGVARRFRLNVGMSGEGDINLVPASAQSMMSSNEIALAHDDLINSGYRFGFDPLRPYVLPKDAGLVCEIKNMHASEVSAFGGVNFMGYEKVAQGKYRNPVHLAGYLAGIGTGQFQLQPGADATLNMADLRNNGRDDVILTDMILEAGGKNTSGTVFTAMDNIGWRVNPSTGLAWMPDPEHIPVGCVAPFNRAINDLNDLGARVYSFPPQSFMKPKAELSVDLRLQLATAGIGNTAAQTIHICLFGWMEVT